MPTVSTRDNTSGSLNVAYSYASLSTTASEGADYTITGSETFANGSGEAFWLVIVPENALPGQVSVEISCGAAPVSRQLTIT